jgi:TetR/AcrR family transcriptional regulator
MVDKMPAQPVRESAQAQRAAFTRQAILDAAEETFAKSGFQGARVRTIADAAGVNVATLYNYYQHKEALYEAVLERGIQPVVEVLKTFSAQGHIADSTRELNHAIMSHLRAHPNVCRLVYLEAVTEGAYLKKMAQQWFRPFIEAVAVELDAESEAEAWQGSIQPFLSALFIHLSFGHFALAPLFGELFGHDPLSDAGIEQQTLFIEQLTSQIFPKMNPP